MFCTLRQKSYSFNCALALWRGLNGVVHRCGNYKNQRQGKRRVLLLLQDPLQTRAIRILHTICQAFICLRLSLKPAEASLWKVLGEQVQRNKPTSSGRKAGFKRLHSHKERISRWDADPLAYPLFITAIKQISWGRTRHFGSASDFWHCSGI